MNRRRLLALGGAVASTGLLSTLALAETDDGSSTVSEAASTDRVDSVELPDASEIRSPGAPDSDGTDLDELETTALEAPGELSEEEIETLLSVHEDHASCPICQGLGPGGPGPGGPGGPGGS